MPRTLLGCVFVLGIALLPLGTRAADPFEIYVSLPLTGQVAFLGAETARGVQALEAYVNKNGGIRGRPIKFVIEDDQSNPAVALQVMSQILAKKPPIIIGGELAANCNAMSGLLKDDGPILYCFTAGVHPPPGSWIYASSFSTSDMVATAIRYLRLSGLTKIATITTTDASGQDGDRTIDGALALPENKSIVVTTREHFTSPISQSPRSLHGSSNRVRRRSFRGRAERRSAPSCAASATAASTSPVITTPANLIYSQLEQYKTIMPPSPVLIPGIPAVVPESVTDRGVKRAIDQYDTAMKAQGIPRPDVAEAIVWDGINVVLAGFKKLGFDATSAQLRDFINSTQNWDGALGVLDYKAAPQRGVQPQWCMMVRWDATASKFVAVSKLEGAPLK